MHASVVIMHVIIITQLVLGILRHPIIMLIFRFSIEKSNKINHTKVSELPVNMKYKKCILIFYSIGRVNQ